MKPAADEWALVARLHDFLKDRGIAQVFSIPSWNLHVESAPETRLIEGFAIPPFSPELQHAGFPTSLRIVWNDSKGAPESLLLLLARCVCGVTSQGRAGLAQEEEFGAVVQALSGSGVRGLKRRGIAMNQCGGRWGSCLCVVLGLLAAGPAHGQAGMPKAASCRKIAIEGEATVGQEWRVPFGQGWVFRLVPIAPSQNAYTGWDLVVDREQGAGFPDALLVATPPYNSINEREVGTTFGLRAQDAIGWNPRSFHFLTAPDALRESQKLFQILGAAKFGIESPVVSERIGMATQRQLKMNQRASAGQFRILDARLSPGVADAAPYAESWALASPKTRHTVEAPAAGKSTQLGELHWIRFSITLWLPPGWRAPKGLEATRAACSE
jgi:hypothetical protein